MKKIIYLLLAGSVMLTSCGSEEGSGGEGTEGEVKKELKGNKFNFKFNDITVDDSFKDADYMGDGISGELWIGVKDHELQIQNIYNEMKESQEGVVGKKYEANFVSATGEEYPGVLEIKGATKTGANIWVFEGVFEGEQGGGDCHFEVYF